MWRQGILRMCRSASIQTKPVHRNLAYRQPTWSKVSKPQSNGLVPVSTDLIFYDDYTESFAVPICTNRATCSQLSTIKSIRFCCAKRACAAVSSCGFARPPSRGSSSLALFSHPEAICLHYEALRVGKLNRWV